jgi:hypothetical protein
MIAVHGRAHADGGGPGGGPPVVFVSYSRADADSGRRRGAARRACGTTAFDQPDRNPGRSAARRRRPGPCGDRQSGARARAGWRGGRARRARSPTSSSRRPARFSSIPTPTCSRQWESPSRHSTRRSRRPTGRCRPAGSSASSSPSDRGAIGRRSCMREGSPQPNKRSSSHKGCSRAPSGIGAGDSVGTTCSRAKGPRLVALPELLLHAAEVGQRDREVAVLRPVDGLLDRERALLRRACSPPTVRSAAYPGPRGAARRAI